MKYIKTYENMSDFYSDEGNYLFVYSIVPGVSYVRNYDDPYGPTRKVEETKYNPYLRVEFYVPYSTDADGSNEIYQFLDDIYNNRAPHFRISVYEGNSFGVFVDETWTRTQSGGSVILSKGTDRATIEFHSGSGSERPDSYSILVDEP